MLGSGLAPLLLRENHCQLRVIGVDQSKLKSVNVRTVVDSKRQDTVVPAYVEQSSRRERSYDDAVNIPLGIAVDTLRDAHGPLRHCCAFSEREAHVRCPLKVGRPVSVQYVPGLAEHESHDNYCKGSHGASSNTPSDVHRTLLAEA